MDERLRKAERNFKNFLQEGLITKQTVESFVIDKYTDMSLESLRTASELFNKEKSNFWVIIMCYYSMFYAACSFICWKGYKPGSQLTHSVVNEALIVLARKKLSEELKENYIEQKKAAFELLEEFNKERRKRNKFQYEVTSNIKEANIKTSLERAKAFVIVFRDIMQKNK